MLRINQFTLVSLWTYLNKEVVPNNVNWVVEGRGNKNITVRNILKWGLKTNTHNI